MFDCRNEKILRGAAAVLLFALPFSFPLAFGKIWMGLVPLFGEAPGVDFSILALLSTGAIVLAFPFLKPLAKQPESVRILFAGSGVGSLIVLLQQGMFGWNAVSLLSGIACFLVPIAGLLLARELRRILPIFFSILICVSGIMMFHEYFREKFAVGLAGNWNWNWTLLTAAAPGLAFFLRDRRRKIAVGIVLAFAVAFGQYLFCGYYSSRGTVIAAPAAAATLGAAWFLHRQPRFRKGFAVVAILLVLAVGSGIYYGVRSGYFSERLPGENRLMVWQGSLALGEAHWFSGVGQDRYEGEIAPFLPVSYFDSDLATDRHPHPHNELLFYWCSFGVVGILWWLLTLWIGIRSAVLRQRRDELTLLALWGWWLLFFHGEIDVLLQTPLAGGLFLLLTGMLAGTGVRRVKKWSVGRIRIAVAVGCAIVALVFFFLNLCGGWFCRSGKLALLAGDPETARRDLRRSVSIRPTAETLYTLATVELFDFQNPVGAGEALRRIRDELRLSSYAHSSGRLARAFAARGRLEESLPFFAAEQENFPRSAVNLFLWQSVLRQLVRTTEADEMLGLWREVLKIKGIGPEEFPWLMQNQLLDDSPQELRFFLNRERK